MRSRAFRSFVVVLSLAAWFALSNHCALATAVSPSLSVSQKDGCPMHSAPAKKLPGAKPPCCKDLRAIVAKWITPNPGVLRMMASRDYAAQILADPAPVGIAIELVDTGPPGCLSFAESVLQESMLSHAPPVS